MIAYYIIDKYFARSPSCSKQFIKVARYSKLTLLIIRSGAIIPFKQCSLDFPSIKTGPFTTLINEREGK